MMKKKYINFINRFFIEEITKAYEIERNGIDPEELEDLKFNALSNAAINIKLPLEIQSSLKKSSIKKHIQQYIKKQELQKGKVYFSELLNTILEKFSLRVEKLSEISNIDTEFLNLFLRSDEKDKSKFMTDEKNTNNLINILSFFHINLREWLTMFYMYKKLTSNLSFNQKRLGGDDIVLLGADAGDITEGKQFIPDDEMKFLRDELKRRGKIELL